MHRFIKMHSPALACPGLARTAHHGRRARTAAMLLAVLLATPALAIGAPAPQQAEHQSSPMAERDGSVDAKDIEGIELRGEAWVRMLPPGQTTTAAFFTLGNRSDQPLTIRSATSPAAEQVELHSHVADDRGVMRMRQIDEIVVDPQDETTLEPGGLHLMLIGLHEPLTAGQAIPITLSIEDHDDLTIEAVVRPMGKPMPAH